MNKWIKSMASTSALITIFFTIESLSLPKFQTNIAYAMSYQLTDLKMENGNGGDVNLYENDNYTRELDSDRDIEKTYYAKVSSDTSKVSFNTSGFDGDIKIFKDRSSKVYDSGKDIPILTGKTTFHIRLYDTYDESNPNNFKKEYKVIVKKYTSEEENEINNDDQGGIYLKNIELDYGDIPIGFNREKSNYTVNVDSDVKSLAIKAEPEDGATTVKINNLTIDEDDGYKKDIDLVSGENKFEITLSQEGEKERTYIVDINRAVDSNKATKDTNTEKQIDDTDKAIGNNVNTSNNTGSSSSPNSWVQVSGKWKYNDGFGNPIRNTWYYDNNYKTNYYFDADGYMVVGWLRLDNNWYYLNSSGAMETGWKQVGGNWYYLDYDGKMRTGWFKDVDGKYYYLNENGAMVHDAVINGYKLGNDGAWKK